LIEDALSRGVSEFKHSLKMNPIPVIKAKNCTQICPKSMENPIPQNPKCPKCSSGYAPAKLYQDKLFLRVI